MTNKLINYILVGIAVFIVGLMVWLHFAPHTNTASASPAGTTGTLANFYSVTDSMSGTATSTSITNNSGNDYIVGAIEGGCEGLGTALSYVSGSGIKALTLTVATSSTANPITTNTNANTVGGGGLTSAMTIGTSTGNFSFSSSTPNLLSTGGSTLIGQIWAAGSNLTFYVNATTTGSCTFGVRAFSL